MTQAVGFEITSLVRRVPFVLAAICAAAIAQAGSATAQQFPDGVIDGRAAPTSSHIALSSQAACSVEKKQVCEELVQDNILWRVDDPDNSASKHWQQKNLDDLCACTADPYETVNCFQIEVNNKGKVWQEAIAACRAQR